MTVFVIYTISFQDVEDLFHKYGNIEFIDLKNKRGPPFAFVEFDDRRYVKVFFNYEL